MVITDFLMMVAIQVEIELVLLSPLTHTHTHTHIYIFIYIHTVKKKKMDLTWMEEQLIITLTLIDARIMTVREGKESQSYFLTGFTSVI